MPGAEGSRGQEALKAILVERARKGKARWFVLAVAVFFAFLELYYILHFNITLFRLFYNMGLNLQWLLEPQVFNQTYPAKAIVLSIVVMMGILLYPFSRRRPREDIPWYDWVLAAIGFMAPLYIVYLYLKHHTVEAALAHVDPFTVAIIVAIIAFVAEATRRALGWILPLVMLVFVAYGFYYAYVYRPPGVEGLQWMRRLFNLFIAQNTGFLGIPLEVMVTYVFAFLFFSSLLDKLGVGRYITELLLAALGRRPGGPAKVAVVSSALMGTISGSSVANVLTTGTFTIPTMKRAGFPPEVAGAIEPVASTGGQLMPPIMGAAAFIMAEFIGRPYRDVMIAAALPAILYFYSIYVFVDKMTRKLSLKGLSAEEVPPLRPLLLRFYMLLPIPIIIVALLRIEPQHAVMAAVGSAVMVAWIDAKDVSWRVKAGLIAGLVALTWLVHSVGGLPFASSLFFVGIVSILLALAVGVAVRGVRHVARAVVEAVEASLRNSVPVFLAAATASVIQAMISFTGLAKTLGDILLAASLGNLYLLLVMVALFSIILGMGVPTTANYIITSTVLAPTLVAFIVNTLGYPEETAVMSAHMFVFYYGILADITPPVALAAFVGAVLAGADFWKTAVNATIFGFAKYILPFVFVVSPYLLVTAIPEWGERAYAMLAYTVAAVLVIIHLAASGFTGWLLGPINSKPLRLAMIVVAIAAVSLRPELVAAAAVFLAVIAALRVLVHREL